MTAEKNDRTTPHDLWRYGRDFYTAANRVKNGNNVDTFMPYFFLVYQSIELSLKAYLLKGGITISELKGRKYGHNIQKILDTSIEKGLLDQAHLNEGHIAAIKVANNEYLFRRFQYIETGSMTVPDVKLIDAAASLLTEKLEAFCCIPRNVYRSPSPTDPACS